MAVGADTAISADLTNGVPDWTNTLQTLERTNQVKSAIGNLEANPQSGSIPGQIGAVAAGQSIPPLRSASWAPTSQGSTTG